MAESGLKAVMLDGVNEGVFPGGVLIVARGDRIVERLAVGRLSGEKSKSPDPEHTVYDLASLTKVLSTVVLTMIFVDQGRFRISDPLARLWPGAVPADKKKITIAQLLSHASGMAAWRPFFEELENLPEQERRNAVAKAILNDPLEAKPGKKAIYSDLNYILLGLILEAFGRARQDVLFNHFIARPLNLTHTGYRPLDRPPVITDDAHVYAPTENIPRRGGVIRGQVHDDNAAALSGVAGHAGLFGTAMEVWTIFQALRRAHREETESGLVLTQTVRRFWQDAKTAPNSTWTLGFDRPSQEGSSSGRHFSKQSIGHLGYTGTSLWYDTERDLTVIMLTNRVYPTSENQAIKSFRPIIHDAVVSFWG
jgi:serine-type D-Ala-D-Ala carboxypeptidase